VHIGLGRERYGRVESITAVNGWPMEADQEFPFRLTVIDVTWTSNRYVSVVGKLAFVGFD
jgi:hypothetical protein